MWVVCGRWAGLCVEVSPGHLGPCTGMGAPDALDGQPPLSLRGPPAAAAQSARGFSSDSWRRRMFPEMRFSCSNISELHACSCVWGCKLCCLSVGLDTAAPGALPSRGDSTPLRMTLLLTCTVRLAEVSMASGRVVAAWVRPHCGLWAGEDLGILCERGAGGGAKWPEWTPTGPPPRPVNQVCLAFPTRALGGDHPHSGGMGVEMGDLWAGARRPPLWLRWAACASERMWQKGKRPQRTFVLGVTGPTPGTCVSQPWNLQSLGCPCSPKCCTCLAHTQPNSEK